MCPFAKWKSLYGVFCTNCMAKEFRFFFTDLLVHLVYGELGIEWADDGCVYQEGPAAEVYTGVWPNGVA